MMLAESISTQLLPAISAGAALAEADSSGASKFFYRLLPPFSVEQSLIIVCAVLGGAVVLRLLLGPANPVSHRSVLWALRGVILFLIAVILFANPVREEMRDGPITRPEVFYLLDTSASMQMGNPRSRWDESLAMIRQAQERSTKSPAVIKPFRFGQRLAAIDQPAQIGLSPQAAPAVTPVSAKDEKIDITRSRKIVAPTDGDTRLQAALKQISSRFSRVPPQGVVVFSDGRVHDDKELEKVAADFAKLKVPIHIVPVGDTAIGGDVAIAAVVAPPRVRNLTQVEVQVFLRSFGYDGKRIEVHLDEIGPSGEPTRQLAPPLPVTLQSGFQSVSLSFRSDLSTKKLRVSLPPLAAEVSDRNNQLETEMSIERTKIRVLYVEGSSQPITTVRVGDRNQYRGPFTDLKQALSEDEDIECVVLVSPGGVGQLVRIAEYATVDGVRGFPTTIAELAAFDAIILSDVSAEAFTETQLAWIEQWIGQRGGGLCMVGGEHSFSSGGWDQTPLAAMLPVEMLPGGADWVPGETVRIAPELPPTLHPLWSLMADDKQNRQIVSQFPLIAGINRWAGARPNLTTVLATTSVSGTPVIPAETGPLSVRGLTSVLEGIVGNGQPKGVAAPSAGGNSVPAIVAGRYGKGRTLALAFPITSPAAEEFVQKWGVADNRYYSKFNRNLVYWLIENSAIGRRRLVAMADKRFYRPGETIKVQAATYDESSAPTKNYRVVAMVEPHSTSGADAETDNSPVRWPTGMTRTSGEEGQYVVWGEEFELPLGGQDQPQHAIQLPLADSLSSGTSSQSLRLELTAYEDLTQVDSTSLDIQILHDPFEQQNPFPNHELLAQVAAASGGKVLKTPEALAQVLNDVPKSVGPPIVKKSPMWSNWWLWGLVIGLLTVEWCWRRRLGLA
ncbi:MAG TPA: glutamine amidotransferase [Pirellulaceae bacterium]|nr:glutamine amidotransferase [Pirellulaceae bacterium]